MNIKDSPAAKEFVDANRDIIGQNVRVAVRLTWYAEQWLVALDSGDFARVLALGKKLDQFGMALSQLSTEVAHALVPRMVRGPNANLRDASSLLGSLVNGAVEDQIAKEELESLSDEEFEWDDGMHQKHCPASAGCAMDVVYEGERARRAAARTSAAIVEEVGRAVSETLDSVVASFLDYAFRDVSWDYDQLTASEQALCTREQFDGVAARYRARAAEARALADAAGAVCG